MGRLARALAFFGCVAMLAGCYNGKGTDSGYATSPPTAPGRNGPAVLPSTSVAGASRFGAVRFSFTDHYAQGAINSEAAAATPNHRGVLVMSPVVDGVPTSALTVLASYRYSYRLVVPPSSILEFDAGKPYSIGTSTTGFVDIDAGGKRERLFQADLPPANADGTQWYKYSKPLGRYAGKNVVITFGADATNGDATAAWVEFVKAGLYAKRTGRSGNS